MLTGLLKGGASRRGAPFWNTRDGDAADGPFDETGSGWVGVACSCWCPPWRGASVLLGT